MAKLAEQIGKKIGATSYMVYRMIVERKGESGCATVHNKDIAEALGLCNKTVSEAIGKLTKTKLITRDDEVYSKYWIQE